jgi:type III pantothenate kinase
MAAGSPWLALAIGNSRYHWAFFNAETLHQSWHTLATTEPPPPIATAVDLAAIAQSPIPLPDSVPLVLASVVPAHSRCFATYPHCHTLTLAAIPLADLYPTLGLDRALTALAAVHHYGAPVLVIDAGTALTFTGLAPADASNGWPQLVGGAILPGLGLQLRALGQSTAALPNLASSHLWRLSGQSTATALPDRWARETAGAIASGVLYTLVASLQSFIDDWQQRFPGSAVVLTGGDGATFQGMLAPQYPPLVYSPQLIFEGMAIARSRLAA